jgi:hypothetical protein
VTKQAAGEEAAKFLFNKPRISVAIRFARLIQERFEVLLNHPVQDRLFGLMATIGAPRQGRAPHSGHARQRRGSGTGGPFIGDRRKCRRSDARARGVRNQTATPLPPPAHARECRHNVHKQ